MAATNKLDGIIGQNYLMMDLLLLHLKRGCILQFFFSLSGRRNPFRMLSNAIDFRNRRKVQRPKSADQDRSTNEICVNPSGGM